MTEQRRQSLLRIVEQELAEPASDEALRERLGAALPAHSDLLDFLALRREHSQSTFLLRAQRALFRRFGWRVIRPFFLVGVLAGVGFTLQSHVDPTLGVMLFLAGAATLYVVIQIAAMRWSSRDEREQPRVDAEYRARLEELRERLRAQAE
ncbi:MAG: hypothetical protein JSW67_00160 [Candidatus Latescibacterota bacterium]|nr:MAG: hypothetical protein JSW67_00160 [Candidatus Latescibacterota bacterium]